MVKLLIVFYSATGTGKRMATFAKDAADNFGAEVRMRQVKELAPASAIDANPLWRENFETMKDIEEATSDDLLWAEAIIFSSPSRFGVMAAQMKEFMDMQGGLWAKGLLANKFVTAFTSAQNPNGGQERVIESIYTVASHWGCIIVPTGYVQYSTFTLQGNPYGVSATVDSDGRMLHQENVKIAIYDQTKRMLEITKKYLNGK